MITTVLDAVQIIPGGSEAVVAGKFAAGVFNVGVGVSEDELGLGQVLSSAGLGIAVGDLTFEEGTFEALENLPYVGSGFAIAGTIYDVYVFGGQFKKCITTYQ